MRSWSRCEQSLVRIPVTASRFNRYDARCRRVILRSSPLRSSPKFTAPARKPRALGTPHLQGHRVEVGQGLLRGDPGFRRSVGSAEGAEPEKPSLLVHGAIEPLLLADVQITVVRATYGAASVDVLHTHRALESTFPAQSEADLTGLIHPSAWKRCSQKLSPLASLREGSRLFFVFYHFLEGL